MNKFGSSRLWAGLSIFVVLFLYLKVILRRVLINDDYMALYASWRQGIGGIPSIDFNADSYTLLFDVLAPISLLVGQRIEVIYFFRVFVLLVLALICVQLYYLLRDLTAPAPALIAVLCVLLATPIYTRGLDIRPDLFIVACWLQIVLLLRKSEKYLSVKSMLLVGIVLAISFLFKFKSILIVVPMTIYFLYSLFFNETKFEINKKKAYAHVKAVGFALTGFIAIAMVYLAYLWMMGNLDHYIEVTQKLIVGSSNKAPDNNLKIKVLKKALNTDEIFFVLTGLGLIQYLWKSLTLNSKQHYIVLFLSSLGFLSVYFNPHYYHYNLTTLYLVLAAFLALTAHTLIHGKSKLRFIFLPVFLVGLSLSGTKLYKSSTQNHIEYQTELQQFILDTTEPDDAIFAFEGIGLFRPSTYHWRTSWIRTYQFRRKEYSVWKEIKIAKPVLIIRNYRVPGWLLKKDQKALANHYTPLTSAVMALGFSTTTSKKSNILKGGAYRILNSRDEPCQLNEQKLEANSMIVLDEGPHRLSVVGQGKCTVVWDISKEAIARLKASNPKNKPYLLPPSLK